MGRFVIAVFAASLAACATVEGWFESGTPFELVEKQARSILGVAPRLAGDAEGLAASIDALLDDPTTSTLELGNQLSVALGRVSSGAAELDAKRRRLKTLGERMQAGWDEAAPLLPADHPWADPGSSADEKERIANLMQEVDGVLMQTSDEMLTAVNKLRPAISALRKAAGQGQVASQADLLEQGRDALRTLAQRITDDVELVRELAEEFVGT